MLIHVEDKSAQVLDADAAVVISFHQSLGRFQLEAFAGDKRQCIYALTDAAGIQAALTGWLASLPASKTVGQ